MELEGDKQASILRCLFRLDLASVLFLIFDSTPPTYSTYYDDLVKRSFYGTTEYHVNIYRKS